MRNVYIRGRKGHGLILLSKLFFFDYINYWGVFAHLKFFLICVPTSVGRGGWQATWDNDGFPKGCAFDVLVSKIAAVTIKSFV